MKVKKSTKKVQTTVSERRVAHGRQLGDSPHPDTVYCYHSTQK